MDAAAAVLADPLAQRERQQIFLLYDISLAGIELSLARGEIDEAIRQVETTATRFNEIGARAWLPDIHYAGGRAYIAAGQLDEAAVSLNEAVSIARSLGMRGMLWRFLSAAMSLEETRGNSEAAAALRNEASAEIEFVAGNIWPQELRESFLAQPDVTRVRQLIDQPQ